MRPFWIKTGHDLRLAIVPRPRGGDWLEDDLRAMKGAGVDVLVSMLPHEEANELGLDGEASVCAKAGIAFKAFAIPDRQVPGSMALLTTFLGELRQELSQGKSVAVHCRASIGRSSLLLAALLCAQGWTVPDAFECISLARGLQVPDTQEQVQWVEAFAATL